MTEQMKEKLPEVTTVYIALAAIMLILFITICGCASKSSAETPDIEFIDIEVDIEVENLLSIEQAVFVAGTNNIIINAGSEWELEGILTLPEGTGPFPLVVIVHGSGQARKNRYHDLTNFLAEQGVASIRHDKRPTAYPEIAQDVSFTLKEESVDDALSAVALAKTIQTINQDMIFVLGHSQGGFLIPIIHEGDKEDMIAGFISLAGGARPFVEHLKELVEMGVMDDLEIEVYEDDIKNLLAGADLDENYRIADQYPAYWLYLADYDPVKSAKNIDKPILFMQGADDNLLLPDNLDMWKLATQNNQKAVYRFYPELDHFFRKLNSAFIEEEVVIDIAEFIKSQYK